MKKYIELPENQTATHLKIETCYSLGGNNPFTGRNESRGYYLHVVPVTRETRNGYALESFVAYSGIKQLIHPVTRKSAGAGKIAETNAAAIEKTLVEWVCSKAGLPMPEGV